MKDQKGSLIVESIVGISIAIVGLMGVLGLLSRSLAINKDIGQKFVATYLAAEGIEVVKSLIDKNCSDRSAWNDGISDGTYEVVYDGTDLSSASGNPLLFDSADGTYSYTRGDPTHFTRTIVIEEIEHNSPPDGTDEIQVNSVVQWSARGVVQEVNLEDHFFDWRTFEQCG